MIAFAKPEQFAALQTVWRTCFGDSREYTELIFDKLLGKDSVLVYSDGEGKPMAMLCLAPFTMTTLVGELPAAYIFGVATLPEHQGKGLSTALLDETHKRLRERGDSLSVLVPAGESLFRFYGKRGYETAFSTKIMTATALDLPRDGETAVLKPSSLDKLAELRDRYFADSRLYVRWDRDYLAAITAETALLGGEVLETGCVGETGYAVCIPVEDRVYVKELAASEERQGDILAAIHARYGAREYQVRLHPDTVGLYPNRVLPFAMVQWYDKDKQAQAGALPGRDAYIAHVLD